MGADACGHAANCRSGNAKMHQSGQTMNWDDARVFL
ncbi:LysR family transcriptional regulator, partial [Bacteroides thetaiotaomicron]|nr:LysR family transcriptional regulator [Bacteroides thetaiotaomicron]